MVGDRAAVESVVGGLDASLGGPDDRFGFAGFASGRGAEQGLGLNLAVKRLDKRWVGDLLDDRLEDALGVVALQVNLLQLLHFFEIHVVWFLRGPATLESVYARTGCVPMNTTEMTQRAGRCALIAALIG